MTLNKRDIKTNKRRSMKTIRKKNQNKTVRNRVGIYSNKIKLTLCFLGKKNIKDNGNAMKLNTVIHRTLKLGNNKLLNLK